MILDCKKLEIIIMKEVCKKIVDEKGMRFELKLRVD